MRQLQYLLHVLLKVHRKLLRQAVDHAPHKGCRAWRDWWRPWLLSVAFVEWIVVWMQALRRNMPLITFVGWWDSFQEQCMISRNHQLKDGSFDAQFVFQLPTLFLAGFKYGSSRFGGYLFKIFFSICVCPGIQRSSYSVLMASVPLENG